MLAGRGVEDRTGRPARPRPGLVPPLGGSRWDRTRPQVPDARYQGRPRAPARNRFRGSSVRHADSKASGKVGAVTASSSKGNEA